MVWVHQKFSLIFFKDDGRVGKGFNCLYKRRKKEQKRNLGTNIIYYLYFVFSTKPFRKNFYKCHPSGCCFIIFLLLARLLKATDLSRRKTKQKRLKERETVGLHYNIGWRILKKINIYSICDLVVDKETIKSNHCKI